MIEPGELWPSMGALSSQRFDFLVRHVLRVDRDDDGYQELTPGEVLQLGLTDRLTAFGIDNDVQQCMLSAWGANLECAGTHWAEALVGDASYTKTFFAVSDFVFSSMPYSKDSKFHNAQAGQWIDVLPRHAEVIIHLDLTEMMLRILSRINERRGKHGQEPIDLRPASEVSSS